MGAAAIEYHPGPVDLDEVAFGGWCSQCLEGYHKLQAVAAGCGFQVGSHGTIPWVPITKVARSVAPRYKILPDFHKDHRALWNRNPKIGSVSLVDPGVVGLLNAFQFSVQAEDLVDGIDKLNRLYYISPMAVALAPNASTLGGMKTGWADARFEVWRRSFDTRNWVEKTTGKALRIGLPNKYFTDVWDYFKNIVTYPFILDDINNALRIGIGAYWRDARLKFAGKHVVVEFRPLSMQGTVNSDIVLASFVLGRLLWSQHSKEVLLPMDTVQLNKRSAEMFGLNARLATETAQGSWKVLPARIALKLEVERAIEGLRVHGILDQFAEKGLGALRSKLSG